MFACRIHICDETVQNPMIFVKMQKIEKIISLVISVNF